MTAGGVALLEACLLGRPIVALALAENQRQAVSGLEREGAVVVATPETCRRGGRGARGRPELAGSRFRMPRDAAIDGKGAARVADTLEQSRWRDEARTLVVVRRAGAHRLDPPARARCSQDLGGRPLLRFMLDRLADLRVDELVVATSTLDRDDAVVDVAQDAGRQVVRGSEADVLDRFATALDAHPADHVIRLTADCPLADPVLDRGRAGPASRSRRRLHVERVPAYVSAWSRLRGHDSRRAPHRARGSNRPGRARARDALPLPPARALRAGQHAQRHRRSDAEGWTVDTADDLAFVRRIVDAMNARLGRRHVLLAGGVAGGRARGRSSRCRRRRRSFRRAGSTAAFFLACRNDTDAVQHSRSRRPDRPRRARAMVRVQDRRSRRTAPGCGSCRVSPSARCASTYAAESGRSASRSRPRSAARASGTALLEALVEDVGDRSSGRDAHCVGARGQHAVDARVRAASASSPTAPTASSADSGRDLT